jgi:hypothetical protein
MQPCLGHFTVSTEGGQDSTALPTVTVATHCVRTTPSRSTTTSLHTSLPNFGTSTPQHILHHQSQQVVMLCPGPCPRILEAGREQHKSFRLLCMLQVNVAVNYRVPTIPPPHTHSLSLSLSLSLTPSSTHRQQYQSQQGNMCHPGPAHHVRGP